MDIHHTFFNKENIYDICLKLLTTLVLVHCDPWMSLILKIIYAVACITIFSMSILFYFAVCCWIIILVYEALMLLSWDLQLQNK